MTLGLAVLVFGALGLVSSIVSSLRLGEGQREEALATEAARAQLELLSGEPFETLFTRFNDEPADDPGLPGSAPGASFPVAGLDARADDADGLSGRIVFPVGNVRGVLREDLVDNALGMPMDLNLDGVTDAANHADDYEVLPVLVRVAWRGAGGNGSIAMTTWLRAR